MSAAAIDGRTAGGESVVFSNVTKSYGNKEVLHSFNFDIKAGEMICLLGPSGCGKSTALRCLSGFENITKGDIRIGERSVAGVPPRKRGIGMVFQQYSLFPNMNVLDNVAFGLKVKKVPKDERRTKAREMLKIVGLEDYAESFPNRLSGGQQQRVALARALVMNPSVLLLDEPLSALDAKIRVQLRDEIRALQRKLGITAIFVTHDQEEALAVADRIAVMHDGNIEQIGTPKELYLTPATPFVADFVGQSNKVETTVQANGKVNVCGFELPLSTPLPANTLATVFIRPENVIIEHDEQSRFEVSHTSFLGSIERTSVRADNITLVSQHALMEQYEIGDRVRLTIRPEAVVAEPIDLRWAQDAMSKTGETDSPKEA